MNKHIKQIARFVYYLPSNLVNYLQYTLKHVHVGKNHETRGILIIRNRGSISIGNSVRINSSERANPIGAGNHTCFQVLPMGRLTIGNHTRMSNCAITVAEQVIIGNYVRIGAGVRIYDTDFHSLLPIERSAEPEIATAKHQPIVVEDYSFLGAGSYVLKGVVIGRNAVIGAGSVVTKNVPANEIWAGNPARRIGIVPGICG